MKPSTLEHLASPILATSAVGRHVRTAEAATGPTRHRRGTRSSCRVSRSVTGASSSWRIGGRCTPWRPSRPLPGPHPGGWCGGHDHGAWCDRDDAGAGVGFTPAVWIAFVGVVGQALVTYLLSNAEPSAGGRRGPSRLGSRVCL